MKAKILIVEDEIIIAMELKSYLEKLGYIVPSIETNYDSAIESFKKYLPDLALIDINLKGEKTGIDIAEEINKIKKIPFIYISAFSDLNTIKCAVEHNPASFLIKPIKREELKINILLALSNTNYIKHDIKQFKLYEDCYFDLENETLFESGKVIRLSKNEKKLLRLLIENKNQIIHFSDLKDEIWSKINCTDGMLRTLIYRLRQKLNNYSCIETIPSVGCKLLIE